MRRLVALLILGCLAVVAMLEPPHLATPDTPPSTAPEAPSAQRVEASPRVERRVRPRNRRASRRHAARPTGIAESRSEPESRERDRGWVVRGRVYDRYGDPLHAGTATVSVLRSYCGNSRAGCIEIEGVIEDGRYEIDISEAKSPVARPALIAFEALGGGSAVLPLHLATPEFMIDGDAELEDVRLSLQQ